MQRYLFQSIMSSSSSSSSTTARPLDGIFAINKPSGPTCMSLLEDLKYLFSRSTLFRNKDGTQPSQSNNGGNRGGKRKGASGNKLIGPKIGQGGTLDPLADGVLVIGVGKGTKQLANFLDGKKVK